MMLIMLADLFIVPIKCNTIFLSSTSTSIDVGALASMTLNYNRSIGSDGSTITPTNLSSSTYSLVIQFDQNYRLSSSTFAILNINANYSININTSSNTINFNGIATPVANTATITISNIGNPVISNTALTTAIYIKNSNNLTIDDSYSTLTYNFVVFSTANIVTNFAPANVSTISTLKLNIRSYVYNTTIGMYLEMSFRRWWTRSLVNTSNTAIFSTTSSCIPACSIVSQASTTLVVFNSTSLSSAYNSSTNMITLSIVNIQSPPTL